MNKEQLLSKEYKNEDQMTAFLFEYVNCNYPALRKVFFHVPNGGARDAKEGMKFKSMGATPGVPDFVCVSPLFGLELKMPKGTQSTEQKVIQKVWGMRNVPYHIAWNMEQALDVIESYATAPF